VAYGHVGNSAAVFPLQRIGFEVWPVNTVHFSNHTGYGQWRGSVLHAEDVADII
jgi:pyridoxine kinase